MDPSAFLPDVEQADADIRQQIQNRENVVAHEPDRHIDPVRLKGPNHKLGAAPPRHRSPLRLSDR
jgi:hypothetical protein